MEEDSTQPKGHPPSADLRYGEEDSICPSTLIYTAIKKQTQNLDSPYPVDEL